MVCTYLNTGIHLAHFAAQLFRPLHQLQPFTVQGRGQRALLLEGFLAEAG